MREDRNILPLFMKERKMGREDNQTEMHINRGLALAAFEGNGAGAAYMAVNGVLFDVAMRVLMHPNRRRDSDWR